MRFQKKFVFIFCILLVTVFLLVEYYSFGEKKVSSKIEPYVSEDFSIGGVIAEELLTEQNIINKLGKPIDKKIEIPSAGDKRKHYIYSDFLIKTDIDEESGKELVTWIEITDKKVKTKRGIKIGDKAELVLQKYGPPTNKGKTYFYSVLTDSGYDQPDSHKI